MRRNAGPPLGFESTGEVINSDAGPLGVEKEGGKGGGVGGICDLCPGGSGQGQGVGSPLSVQGESG